MAAYSQDLRHRVLRALERGDGVTATARRFEVSVRWVDEVKRRQRVHGERESRPVGGYRRSRVAGWEPQLRAWIKAEADLTLAQLCERLADQGVTIRPSALWHQLDHWQLTYKKNATRQRASARRRAGGAARLD
ncbi:MAG: transcriptional regulator [Gemmatimonas sp.]|nr:transcriptional regulator [Gemmatimonas sp.]